MYDEFHQLAGDLAEARATITKQTDRIQELEAKTESRLKTKPDLPALVNLIVAHFDTEEINDLAFRLGALPDEIAGDKRRTRAMALVQYCDRMVQLNELLQLCEELRPNVDWSLSIVGNDVKTVPPTTGGTRWKKEKGIL